MKKKFILDGLDCANCAAKMEQAINELDGVRKATVNFMTTKLVIDGEEEKMVKKFEPDTRMKKA